MKSSLVGLIISFLIGSAATSLFFFVAPQKSTPAFSFAEPVRGVNTEAALAQIDQRLRNIEMRLMDNKTQSVSPPISDTADLAKPEHKAVIDPAERAAAIQASNYRVERILQNGRMTESDLNALASAKNLSDEDRTNLLFKLTTAINNDQLKFEPGQ